MSGWDFRIRGYASSNYARQIGAPLGELLLETLHMGESSAAIEIEVWQTRMRRGEISKIELIDLRPGGKLTDLSIDESTQIPWSWPSMGKEKR